MSVADAKAALDACKEGIALITAQQKANEALSTDYNNRLRDWEARKTTFNGTREANKSARGKAQQDWDTRYDQWYRNRREVYNAGCGLCGSNPGCPGGSNDVGNDGCKTNCVDTLFGRACTDGCNRRCQRNDETSRNEATNNTNNERGAKPGNFNDPEFSEQQPTEPQQNQTPINIACCANVTSIVGSDVSDTTINQANDCLKSKEDAVVAAEAKAALPPPVVQPPASTVIPTTTSSTTTTPASTTTTASTTSKNKYIIMIIVCIIIFSLSSSALMVILMV